MNTTIELSTAELEAWIEKRTAESSAESNLYLWDWQAMQYLKAERDRMRERLTAAEESKIRLQWDLDTANARNEMDELAEELAALKTPPDVECWKRLVTIAYAEGGDGALQIERITAEYNRAKAESEQWREAHDEQIRLNLIDKAELVLLRETLADIRKQHAQTYLADIRKQLADAQTYL